MSEAWKLFKIEARKFFAKKKVLALIILSPIVMSAIILALTTTEAASTAEPVHACAPHEYYSIVKAAGGTPATHNCEVSIAAPTEFYYSINIYENTARAEKLEKFAKNFIDQYYYSRLGTTPTITEKTVLVIGDRAVLINAAPSAVMHSLLGLMTALPLVLFMTLLIGNEYVSTSFTSQREKRLLDLISSYPLHRSSIVMSRILLGIVFGAISVLLFIASTGAVLLLHPPKSPTAAGALQPGITLPAWSVLLIIIDTFLVIIFTYFVSITIAFRTKDPSDTSLTSMIVSSILNFSLVIPMLTGSFSILKYSITSIAIPTLIPIQVAVLGLENSPVKGALYTLYLLAITAAAYKLLMKTYEKSFE